VESVLRKEESVVERICEAGRFYPGVKSEGLCFSSRFPAFLCVSQLSFKKILAAAGMADRSMAPAEKVY